MINYLVPVLRPSNKSAFLSSFFSLAASNLAAKTAATATVLFAGLMILPHNQAANVVCSALVSLSMPQEAMQAPLRVARQMRLPTLEAFGEKPAGRLTLRTLEKDYVCVISGKVTCGGGLCNSADLRVHIASKKYSDRMNVVSVQPDGSYTTSFQVKAAMNDHVDWWIVADSPESASKQIQGRQILMDETTVNIDEPIRLL